MKTRFLIMMAMVFSVVGFAQKNEIKAAEKALKAGDAAGAKTALEAASGRSTQNVVDQNASTKSKFQSYKPDRSFFILHYVYRTSGCLGGAQRARY